MSTRRVSLPVLALLLLLALPVSSAPRCSRRGTSPPPRRRPAQPPPAAHEPVEHAEAEAAHGGTRRPRHHRQAAQLRGPGRRPRLLPQDPAGRLPRSRSAQIRQDLVAAAEMRQHGIGRARRDSAEDRRAPRGTGRPQGPRRRGRARREGPHRGGGQRSSASACSTRPAARSRCGCGWRDAS